MKKAADLRGIRFGRLVVSSRISALGGPVLWVCVCDCGGNTVCSSAVLQRGGSRSCGCLAKELTATRNRTHGASKTAEYRLWCSIIRRCENRKQRNYERYGGRGITICKRWRNSFSDFLSDMGKKPFPRATIERVDNSKGYSPENCRWATYKEQGANMRSNHLVHFNGSTKTLTDWANEYGIKQPTLRRRLKVGWAPEIAITTPVRRYG